jgi:hypothetical protein
LDTDKTEKVWDAWDDALKSSQQLILVPDQPLAYPAPVSVPKIEDSKVPLNGGKGIGKGKNKLSSSQGNLFITELDSIAS